MVKVDLWKLDHIQFPRLIAEICATQDINLKTLCESMDLTRDEINELFDRAQSVHEWNVANIIKGEVDITV